jgi:C1A family cysteine protease
MTSSGLLTLCASAILAFSSATMMPDMSSHVFSHPSWPAFTSFASDFNKNYDSEEEVVRRFNNFIDNIERISSHPVNSSYSVGINMYADMSNDEFRESVGGGCFVHPEHTDLYEMRTRCRAYRPSSTSDLPDSVDWRDQNAVTPVKDQGQCGSCWSFSATGSMEGAWAIANSDLVSLSEQQLVDCSTSYGDMGCNGGLMDDAFEYAIDNGMCSEEDDPYTAENGSCDSTCKPVVSMSGCKNVSPANQMDLMAAVANGPVSVAIEADTATFKFYTSGIIDSASCGTNLDHGVLVVGYGEDTGDLYWLVKNSWGTSWGDEGYVKIARTTSTSDPGICGIAMQPSFPVASSAAVAFPATA